MIQTTYIDGREVQLTVDPSSGFVTKVVFPDIHTDNLNPEDPLTVIVTPAQTVEGVQTVIIRPILGANAPNP